MDGWSKAGVTKYLNVNTSTVMNNIVIAAFILGLCYVVAHVVAAILGG